MCARYSVNVGNVGNVYTGESKQVAQKVYNEYVALSKLGIGRVGNETIAMFCRDELIAEYAPDCVVCSLCGEVEDMDGECYCI